MQWNKVMFASCLLFTATLSAMEEEVSAPPFRLNPNVVDESIELGPNETKQLLTWLNIFPVNQSFSFGKTHLGETLRLYRNSDCEFILDHGLETKGLIIYVDYQRTSIFLNDQKDSSYGTHDDKKSFLKTMILEINHVLQQEPLRQKISSAIPDLPLVQVYEAINDYLGGLRQQLIYSSDRQEQKRTEEQYLKNTIENYRKDANRN